MNETLALFLDILGVISLLTGGVIIMRSKYLSENTKDAAILIDTQRKRIDELVERAERSENDRDKLREELHKQAGELEAYKRLNYIEPEVVNKLITALDSILYALTENGMVITQAGKSNTRRKRNGQS